MKIRTFLVCEDIDLDPNDESVVIVKKMMRGIKSKQFPAEESIIILLTTEEKTKKPGELKFTFLDHKGKAISEHTADIEIGEDAFVIPLNLSLPEPGEYNIKITYAGDYIGKYRFPTFLLKNEESGVFV